MADSAREFLRHTLATLAYRGGKSLRGMTPELAHFQLGKGARSPLEILAHIGDLFDWALSLAQGQQRWRDSTPLPWDDEVKRFFAGLSAFDSYLASDQPLATSVEKLFQGPVADALTHIGQIALLRRIAGDPVRAENYFVAKVATGRVGEDQALPVREF